MYAQTPGSSCAMAIPMGANYSARVKSGQTIWYSAWTFDLPLTVTFAPTNGAADPPPVVKMDFSCTTGVYEDSILCSLFCANSGSTGIDYDLPHIPQVSSETLDNGTFVYYLSIGKSYRDIMLQVGIDYNVKVYVQVTYRSDGRISLAPDGLFSNCVDGANFMHLGESVQVAANDSETHVVVPYLQWQEDTIRYVWSGTEPCIVAVGNTCDFNPTSSPGETVLNYFTLQPGESYTIPAVLLYEYVHDQVNYPNEAGMYFAKFYSTAPGVMQIIQAEPTPPRDGATILRYGTTYALNANSQSLFAIPESWTENVKFTTPTEHLFGMTVSSDPDFAEEHIIREYNFDRLNGGGRWLGLLGSDMNKLWSEATENYLYVRFSCTEATTVTPVQWELSECVKSSHYLYSDTTFYVGSNSSQIYRIYYPEWSKGDLTASFSQTATSTMLISGGCDIPTDKNSPKLITYRELKNKAAVTITATEMAGWADRVVDDGFVFLRFYSPGRAGNITILSTAPAEKDPVYPMVTISVACDEAGDAYLRVSEDQHISILQGTVEIRPIEAVVGQTYNLSDLPAGTYILRGQNDEIELKL